LAVNLEEVMKVSGGYVEPLTVKLPAFAMADG
jgi:hypothetical protein